MGSKRWWEWPYVARWNPLHKRHFSTWDWMAVRCTHPGSGGGHSTDLSGNKGNECKWKLKHKPLGKSWDCFEMILLVYILWWEIRKKYFCELHGKQCVAETCFHIWGDLGFGCKIMNIHFSHLFILDRRQRQSYQIENMKDYNKTDHWSNIGGHIPQ